MIIFHKYYLYNLFNKSINDFNSKDFSLLCISCFLLGTKSSDTLIRIDDILNCSYKNNILKNDNNFESHKKIIFNYEYEILSSLGFDIISFELNIKYISNIFDLINNRIKIERDADKIKKLKEFLIAQIRYSFQLPFFLKFNILSIVLSNIIMLMKKLSINFEIEQIISIIKDNGKINKKDINNFIFLYELFLNPKKNINITTKNELNENNTINMDTIRKINIGNSDIEKDCSLNAYKDNTIKV